MARTGSILVLTKAWWGNGAVGTHVEVIVGNYSVADAVALVGKPSPDSGRTVRAVRRGKPGDTLAYHTPFLLCRPIAGCPANS